MPGKKDVISGLTENSWGDGQKANTVYHVYLKEPLHDGRLYRSAGDFLCSRRNDRILAILNLSSSTLTPNSFANSLTLSMPSLLFSITSSILLEHYLEEQPHLLCVER